ncbi:MAG TPA: GGDEF domain-containing protein [Thermoleophilia bacterium]|nr:GGDEF domain-containing protein [Thermoleophilia bacterium]
MTGLFNRRYIDIVLEQHFSLYRRLGQRFGVTQIDIDGFKPINDAFGHATGDEALRFVAGVLSDGTRKMDLLARYGGDEFVVVSAVGDGVALERLAARAVQTVRGSRFVTAAEEALPMTVSAGATLVNPDDTSGASVLARADRAMYDAKKVGGDRFCLVS